MRCSLKFFLALALCVAGASQVQGGVVVATSAESGAGPFTPSYTNPAGNLLLGLSPTAQLGNFSLEGTGGVGVLTNGAFGAITGLPDNNPALATTGNGNGSGSTVTYSLDLGASPTGYDLSSIITQGGWNDGGRDQQKYNVYYSTVAAPATFLPIGLTVDFNPPNGGIPSASQVTITNSTSVLAAGVAHLRFDFGPPNGPTVENDHTGMAELIALGTNSVVPVPNLLANGGFESPTTTGAGNHVGTAPTGWSVNTSDNNSFNLVLDPGGAYDGNQYLDLTAGGVTATQQFTLATTSTIDFGAFFSPRDGGTGGGFVSIYDASNANQLYSSPVVLAGPAFSWLQSSASTGHLGAGTYTFRITLDDAANVDHAFVNVTAVPEPTTLALCLVGAAGLLIAGRRRK